MHPPPAASFVGSGFFILRTPLLPVEELLALGTGLEAPHKIAAEPAALAAALEHDRVHLRARLQAAIERPEVREAIFFASPSLEESIGAWRADPTSERGQRSERSLLRYLARMSGRPTLFGLFAGYSLGRIGAATSLELGLAAGYRRHTRLDEGYLATLAERRVAEAAADAPIRYRRNSSLGRSAGQTLSYVRALPAGASRSYVPIREAAPDRAPAAALTTALALLEAHPEGLGAAELAEQLASRLPALHATAAADCVRELIARQILLPTLAAPVTGADPLAALSSQLAALDPAAAQRLAQTGATLAALDRAGLGAPVQHYRALGQTLGELAGPVDLSHLFYVDLIKPAPAATLGPELLDDLIAGAALLERIGQDEDDGSAALALFRAEFQRRYEDREVPLAVALDEQSGLGFATPGAPSADALPLLQELHFPAPAPTSAPAWGPRTRLLFDKLQESRRTGAQEVSLTAAELDALCAAGPRPRPLPDACAVTATVIGTTADAAPRIHISSITGPSGVSKLGRFCHGDPELAAQVQQHLRAEEALQPDAIFAEVVHLPEGPMGTVISRPLLRAYEIPYLGASGAPPAQQLPIWDLSVSVRGDRVVLRSARLQREVLPRLTSPHNYGNGRNLRLYRFLGALQAQGSRRLARFSWGALEGEAFLPRLVSGRLILSLARWSVRRDQLQPLWTGEGPARYLAVQALRQTLRLPRWVALMDKDNLLPIDLDSVLSIDSVLPLLKDATTATLVELPELGGLDGQPAAAGVRGPEGHYVHQLVVPLLRTATAQPAPSPPPPPVTLPRSFPPGSEWLYAKIYTGTQDADVVLLQAIRPLLEQVGTSGAAQGWFFVRYGDPDWHLRLRVRGVPERLLGEVLPALHARLAPFLADGTVWRVQLDTYERETERYGGDAGITWSESIFQADSESALALLAALPAAGEEREAARWRWTLWSIDRLLDQLGLDFESKWAVISHARERFGAEHGVDARFVHDLGARFRRERGALEALRAGTLQNAAEVTAQAALARRARQLHPVAAELHRAAAAGALGTLVAALAVRYIHMHANRMLRRAARAQELVIYDFLERLYQSEAARCRRRSEHRPAAPDRAAEPAAGAPGP